MTQMMKVAYFSPLAPMRTSVSHYSEELLPYLCRRAHVDVYTDDRIATAQEVGRIYPLYGYHDFQPGRYDHLVFQLASGPEHLPIYDQFVRHGGICVLHDLDLPAIISARTLRHSDAWGYLREVRRNEGLAPFLRTAGDALLRRQWPNSDSGSPRWYEGSGNGGDRVRRRWLEMGRLVVQRAAGLIVHSREAREQLLARHPKARVRQVSLGVRQPPAVDRAEARQLLSLPAGDLVYVSVGQQLTPARRVHVAMQAFARLLERCPDSLYILIGEVAPEYPLPVLAQSLGIAGRVRLAGYVDLATLYRYLAASDVGIGLPSPNPARVSASLLRMLSMGRPVVTFDCTSQVHLPGDSLLKIRVGVGEVAEMAAALWALGGHPPMREWYGQRAARYVQANHSPGATARQYVDFLEELATVRAAEQILLHGQRA
jgi:glycosyltransferase involved in cell wall biosynthesis